MQKVPIPVRINEKDRSEMVYDFNIKYKNPFRLFWKGFFFEHFIFFGLYIRIKKTYINRF